MIAIEGLGKRYGRINAVTGLSFEVEAGRVTGFLGPNGAGKSTTLKMLLGLVRPSTGTALIDGRAYGNLPEPSKQVGAVLEEAGFHPGRTARNHLRVLAAAGRHPESRVGEVLDEVGIANAADRRVKGYSLGMKRRLGIAAALLGDPEVLILDEPTNGLDPPGIRWVRDLLRAQAAAGRTVLVSSHLLSEVAQSVDDVVIISRGVLRASGRLDEVLGAKDPVTRVRSEDTDGLVTALRQASTDIESSNGAVSVRGTTPTEVGAIAARSGVALIELVAQQPSLEDAFLELTKEAS